jgi:anti-sigma factor RsiW
MRCAGAQQYLAAAVDGELAPRRQRAFDRHLAGCAVCRTELASTERLLGAVAGLPREAAVPPRLEQATLRAVRLAAAAEEERAATSWWVALRIPALVAAAAAVVLAVVSTQRGGVTPSTTKPAPRVAAARPASGPAPGTRMAARRRPSRILASRVPSEPPGDLATNADLFVDLPILRNMEKLQHFDAIRTTTLDDVPQTPDGGQDQPNG